MTIRELAFTLNKISKAKCHPIADLPLLRKKFLHKAQLPDRIFDDKTINEKDKYAFHYGGRGEMQFNVGEDYIKNESVTRYCLAFSLEPSRNLTDPLKILTPFRERFNKCFIEHTELFVEWEMWYHTGEDRVTKKLISPDVIDNKMFSLGNFICIGSYIKKSLNEISEDDVEDILSGLDNLIPLYNFCVLNRKKDSFSEERYARVCWNDTEEWCSPTGLIGKSKFINSHERQFGYGHEEWLFDFTRIIDGYHYCLLQSAENGRETFIGRYFNIKLYAHNSETDKYYWIGQINKLQVISANAAEEIYERYKKNNWLNEMSNEIKEVEGDHNKFLSLVAKFHFNIRFKPEDAELFNPLVPFLNFHKVINTHHYQLIKKKQNIVEETLLNRNFLFKKNKANKSLTTRTVKRQKKETQIEPIHDLIQYRLYSMLELMYRKENVSMEHDTGLGTRIDIVVRKNKNYILYEVKSYPSIMISIRIALGQLLEYAFWPTPIDKNVQLIVVSHLPTNPTIIEYLKYLRKVTGLEIYYQQFDLHTCLLMDKV